MIEELSHDLQDHHRTVPHQDGRADPADHTGRARGRAGRGRVQPVPPQGRGCAHRPAHRLGHRRDVVEPVGRHDAGRRVLRRRALVLSLRGGRPGDHRAQARDPDAPGPRRRAHPVRDRGAGGRHRAEQHPLRHDAGQHRGTQRDRAGHPLPGGPAAPARGTRSRATSTWTRWRRCWPRIPAGCRWR